MNRPMNCPLMSHPQIKKVNPRSFALCILSVPRVAFAFRKARTENNVLAFPSQSQYTGCCCDAIPPWVDFTNFFGPSVRSAVGSSCEQNLTQSRPIYIPLSSHDGCAWGIPLCDVVQGPHPCQAHTIKAGPKFGQNKSTDLCTWSNCATGEAPMYRCAL